MKHDLPVEQPRQNLRRQHAGVQLIFPGLDLSICRLESPHPHECGSASDQPFTFKQRGDLLKARPVWNPDELVGRIESGRNSGTLGPLNDLIPGHAENGAADQQNEKNAPKLHQSCLSSGRQTQRPDAQTIRGSPGNFEAE